MAESSNSQTNDQTELTMCDVLEEEQELEDDANAVLGGSDDTNCSYDEGYVPRQALYACTTCSADQEPSGVCLACSYKCHDGHEIVELYTKRNFRCDCGNTSKFPAKTCSLRPDKEPFNQFNKYNQNFKGLYCSCSRPYPDLDDDTPDEMIQCVICEDWYHGRHIGSPVPDEYSEMICSKCMESHKFLYSYLNKFNYVNVNDVEVKEKCGKTSESVSFGDETPSVHCQVKDENVKQEMTEEQVAVNQPKQDVSAVENMIAENDGIKSEEKTTVKKENQDVNSETESEHKITLQKNAACLLNQLHIKPDGITSGPAFWPENWRKELCSCYTCMDMYGKYKCEYLLNVDDTILAYEERGKKSKNESQYDKGLNALSQLDRVNQMEAIRAYTSMKGQLKEYLKDFADSRRTVCESDIKEFFDRIGKRQKLSNGVPHFCR